jgi:hypothetical protein
MIVQNRTVLVMRNNFAPPPCPARLPAKEGYPPFAHGVSARLDEILLAVGFADAARRRPLPAVSKLRPARILPEVPPRKPQLSNWIYYRNVNPLARSMDLSSPPHTEPLPAPSGDPAREPHSRLCRDLTSGGIPGIRRAAEQFSQHLNREDDRPLR